MRLNRPRIKIGNVTFVLIKYENTRQADLHRHDKLNAAMIFFNNRNQMHLMRHSVFF